MIEELAPILAWILIGHAKPMNVVVKSLPNLMTVLV